MKSHNGIGVLGVLTMATVVGCSQSIGPAQGAVERSRQITQLQEENASLQRRVAELETKEKLSSDSEVQPELSGLPVPVELKLARGCEVRSGNSPMAMVRFETLDSRGRFVQVTGPAEVIIVAIDKEGDPHRLIRVELTSEALQRRLRSGFMGMAYAAESPIFKQAAAWIPPVGARVMARVRVSDTRLSEPLVAEELIPVLPPRGSKE